MKREEIGKAMRSCYPEYIVAKRRTTAGVALLEDEAINMSNTEERDSLEGFQDVEQFIAEYEGDEPPFPPSDMQDKRIYLEPMPKTVVRTQPAKSSAPLNAYQFKDSLALQDVHSMPKN